MPPAPERVGTGGPHRHPGELTPRWKTLLLIQTDTLPVTLQLQQTPGPQNPVFLPSDPSCDWLLAKIWVHSADFQGHQLVSHYMRTHMMAELCCIATLRQLPEHHPLHQVKTSRHAWYMENYVST